MDYNYDSDMKMKGINSAMLQDVYRVSLKYSDDGKQRAITEFGNQVYQSCVEAFGK